MRVRLRPPLTPLEMRALYPRPHDHTRWADHIIRVDKTIEMALEMMPEDGDVADLSCGDAAIAGALYRARGAVPILGDFAPGYHFTGPIERTILELPVGRGVDLFILSETLEHLEDPDFVLGLIRDRARQLILSTPVGEMDTGNPEHIWGWGVDDVEHMLRQARWKPTKHEVLEHPAGGIYSFQLWACQ